MLIIAGKLYVDATVRDSYLTDCARLIEQARAAEGCLDFHLSADPSSRTASTSTNAGNRPRPWSASGAPARPPARRP